MQTYDFWLGGCYGLTMAQLLDQLGPEVSPWHLMAMDLVPTGTGYYWHEFRIG